MKNLTAYLILAILSVACKKKDIKEPAEEPEEVYKGFYDRFTYNGQDIEFRTDSTCFYFDTEKMFFRSPSGNLIIHPVGNTATPDYNDSYRLSGDTLFLIFNSTEVPFLRK